MRTISEKKVREVLLDLAGRRAPLTYCPSEAARKLADDWRPLMPRVREVAARLIAQRKLECLQRGKVVAIQDAHGPIRLRSARK